VIVSNSPTFFKLLTADYWGLVGIIELSNKIMRITKLFGIILLSVFVLSGCSKDDENVVMSPANAKGIDIRTDEILECYFWINEYAVQLESIEESEDISRYIFDNIPYYPYTMEKLYGLLSAFYGFEINERNFEKFESVSVDYMKRQLSTYKYVSVYGGDICLFNRISSVNYSK